MVKSATVRGTCAEIIATLSTYLNCMPVVFVSFQVLPQLHPCMRGYSSVHTQQPAGPVREIELDPYIMLDDDIKYVTQDIRDVSV